MRKWRRDPRPHLCVRRRKQHHKSQAEMQAIFKRIDANQNGELSKHEFLHALVTDPVTATFVCPGHDCRNIMVDEGIFDAVDELFDKISDGSPRITLPAFMNYFRKARHEVAAGESTHEGEVRAIFDMIDVNGDNAISKLELANAMRRNPEVDKYIRAGFTNLMDDEWIFDTVATIFHAMANGKQKMSFKDFSSFYSTLEATATAPSRLWASSMSVIERPGKRVFIIGPGFGTQVNPAQTEIIQRAGYQLSFCHNIPNPEQQGFPLENYLAEIKSQMDVFRPDLVVGGSKGGVYVVGLWQVGFWKGPTVLLNAHPSLRRVPDGIPFVLAHGSNDEVYPTDREYLEALVRTGSINMTLLYYTQDSGTLSSGHKSRQGDMHNMQSLASFDCLPRLFDAALCQEGPEVHLVRSWLDRLGEGRRQAEMSLGYSFGEFPRRWRSAWRRGLDDQKCFDVDPSSREFQDVYAVFRGESAETPAYNLSSQAQWNMTRILNMQRVENGLLLHGSVQPYMDLVKKSFKQQDLEFEPGVHTRWVFHGADSNALESITHSSIAGFLPVASGSRAASLWGSGTYFARDAQYVADGGFAEGSRKPDGSRQMLMCLMVVGMPCLGGPQQQGVLPFRQKPHRYNSSVDSLSSPEIFISQVTGTCYPAYLITFR